LSLLSLQIVSRTFAGHGTCTSCIFCPTAHAVTNRTDVICLLQVDMRTDYKQAYKKCWLQYQQKGRGVLTDAVVAAQAIPYSFVQLLDSSGGVAMSLA